MRDKEENLKKKKDGSKVAPLRGPLSGPHKNRRKTALDRRPPANAERLTAA